MIIARIFPKKSQNFKNAKPFFQKIGDSMDSGGWIRLFSLWTLIVAGIVLNMDFENRYVYWSWSGWESGFVKLVVASVVYLYFLNPNNLWIIGSKRLQNKEIIIHAVIAFILLIFGNVGLNSMIPNFFGIFPYFTAFLSCLLIFQFPLILDEDKGVWNYFDWNNKVQYFSLSLILMIASVLLGVFLIHGITVGPQIFDNPNSRELVFSLFAAGLVGITAYGFIGYFFGPWIGQVIARVPNRILYSFIFLILLIHPQQYATNLLWYYNGLKAQQLGLGYWPIPLVVQMHVKNLHPQHSIQPWLQLDFLLQHIPVALGTLVELAPLFVSCRFPCR